MPTDPSIAAHLSTINDNTRRRAPGRPFFDAAGAEHLADYLHQERVEDLRHAAAQPYREAADRSPVSAAEAVTLLEQLRRKIAEATALYGPGLGASILNLPDDTIGRLLELFTAIDVERWRLDAEATDNSAEIARLEHELATAQAQYDRFRALATDAATADNHRRLIERYAEQLEREIHRLATKWSAGHGKRVIDRAYRGMLELGPKHDAVDADA